MYNLRFFLFIFLLLNLIVFPEKYASAYPERIISLAPSITKSLYLLGAGDRVIANTIYCNYPPPAVKKEKVGNVIEINVEKIYSLRPDLIIATPLINLSSKEKLLKLGMNVVIIPSPKNFLELCEQFLEIGKLIGETERAKEIISAAVKEVEEIKGKTKGLKKKKVLVQVGSKPLWVAIKDSFVNDFIEFAGGELAGPKTYGIYSKEEILKQNPEVIIITTMGVTGIEEKKKWEKYKMINAVKNNEIYVLDTDELTSPTPLSFAKTLKKILKILHPEIHEK